MDTVWVDGLVILSLYLRAIGATKLSGFYFDIRFKVNTQRLDRKLFGQGFEPQPVARNYFIDKH
jgi:hypothetical protein